MANSLAWIKAGAAGNGLLTNLEACWPMEQLTGTDAPDVSGNGNTLLHQGTPTQESDHVEGSFSAGVGGVSYFLAAGSFPTSSVVSFSALMWFKFTSGTAFPNPLLTWSGAANSWALAVGTNNTSLTFFVTNAANTSNFTAISTVNVSAAAWHMAVITFDVVSKVGLISVDNETQVSTGTTDGLNSITDPLAVGAFATGSPPAAHIDETAYWLSRVLSASDISTLWNGGTGLFFPSWS